MSQAPKAGNYQRSGEELEKAAVGRINTADTQLYRVTARPLTGPYQVSFVSLKWVLYYYLMKSLVEETPFFCIITFTALERELAHTGVLSLPKSHVKNLWSSYQLELKHPVARVPAGLLHIAGLESAGNILFMDFTMLLTRERMNRRVFLHTPSPPENEKSKSDWKESKQSLEPLPEPNRRSSCSTLTAAPGFHYDELRQLKILNKGAQCPQYYIPLLHKVWCNLELPKTDKIFQNFFSWWNLHSNTDICFSPYWMIYKEQYLDTNILPGIMSCCYA